MKFILLTDTPMRLSDRAAFPPTPKTWLHEWSQLLCSPAAGSPTWEPMCSSALPPPVGFQSWDPAVQSFLHTHCCYINLIIYILDSSHESLVSRPLAPSTSTSQMVLLTAKSRQYLLSKWNTRVNRQVLWDQVPACFFASCPHPVQGTAWPHSFMSLVLQGLVLPHPFNAFAPLLLILKCSAPKPHPFLCIWKTLV